LSENIKSLGFCQAKWKAEVFPSPPQSEGAVEKVVFGVQKLAFAFFLNLKFNESQ
jgi:hypothetical protein